MKTISLEQAFSILENASAVIVNDSALVYPSLHGLCGDDESMFMYLSWNDDDEGCQYRLTFSEGSNKTVSISGCSMFLYDDDSEGEHDYTQLTILVPQEL